MFKKFLFILFNLNIIYSFIHNSNNIYKKSYNIDFITKLKLSRSVEDNNYNLKYKQWNNIFKYLNNKIFNSNYCKWDSNKWDNYNDNSTYNINYKKIYILNSINKKYVKLKKINYYNNTHLHLIDNNIKISLSNNFVNYYNIYIIHPHHSNCRFNVKIYYDNNTKKLNSISLNRDYSGNNEYWSNNTILKHLKYNNFGSDFLFGRNIMYKPFKTYVYKNKKMLYDFKFPHLYEIKNCKDNYIFELPDNILLDIPKILNFKNDFNLKLSWNFKDDNDINILDINFFKNNTLNYFNLFTFI